jgi:hypothetical protein
MKRIYQETRKIMRLPILAVILFTSTVWTSCNFLDIDPYITDLFTLDTVFAKEVYTQRYLNNVYSYLIDDGSYIANQGRSQPWVLITDEGLCTMKNSTHPYNYFANNELLPDNLYSFNRWQNFYEGIRKANTFMQQSPNCKEVSDIQISQWKGEALFVKALLYFELMKEWGPVPIVSDEPIDFGRPVNEFMPPRNTWDECSDYVVGLLQEAIKLLPVTYLNDNEIGKPLKTSAMAVLSRLTLYTASPLFNGTNAEFATFKNSQGVPYLNPQKNMEKWAAAAVAAKELVALKPNDLHTVQKMNNTPYFPVSEAEQADFPNGVGGIDPYHSYSDMFTGVSQLVSANPEVLFSRQVTSKNASNRYAAPRVIDGWGDVCVPQSLVDAYYMIDGRTINNAGSEYPYEIMGYSDNDTTFSGAAYLEGFTILSGTHKMYLNREMRFYATIGYNNSLYQSSTSPTTLINVRDGRVAKFYRDSQSGKDMGASISGSEPEEYPMTGYLCRKFISFEDSWLSGARQSPKSCLAYRMAEVYLNYVEAMNELDKSYTIGETSVSRDPAEMKRCFNLIRYRAGLPGITDADVADVEKMRELILRERQIEFAWEGFRYFDLRRNKKAIIYENAPVMGCNVNATQADMDAFYLLTQVTERNYTYKVFTTRQTFFPIPKAEIDRNPNLTQMIGY